MQIPEPEIHHIDAFEFMEQQPDDSFDLILTSPPYNLNLRVNHKGDGYCSRQVTKELSSKYLGEFDDNMPMEEYRCFLSNLITEANRISKLTVINIQMVTGNKPALFQALGEHATLIKEMAIWDKGRAQPAIGERVLNSRFEMLLFIGDNPITRQFTGARFDRGELDNLWQVRPSPSRNPEHGATFPQELAEHVIRNFSWQGDRVYDPFMGTGTTGAAAISTNRHFTGTEISEEYFISAIKRIDADTQQQRLI